VKGGYCKNILEKVRETESAVKSLQQCGEKLARQNDKKEDLDSANAVYDTIGEINKLLDKARIETAQLRLSVDEVTNRLDPNRLSQRQTKTINYEILKARNIDISDVGDICNTYHVYGMEMLPDNRVILTDYWNKSLKVIEEPNKVQKIFTFNGYPWGLCCIGENRYAVSLTDKKVLLLIKIDGTSVSFLKDISVGQPCRGICYHSEKFFVACAGFQDEDQGHLKIVTMDGKCREIKLNSSRKSMFSRPRQVYVDSSKSELYVTDASDVKVLDLNGNEIRQMSDARLKSPFGICGDGADGILVAGFSSHNLSIIKNFTREFQVFDDTANYINSPVSLFLQPKTGMLFVGMERQRNLVVCQVLK
jgi:hypothetical protein